MRRRSLRLFVATSLLSLFMLVAVAYRGLPAGPRGTAPVLAPGETLAAFARRLGDVLRGLWRAPEDFRRLEARLADAEARLVAREHEMVILSRQMRQVASQRERLGEDLLAIVPARVVGIDPSPWVRSLWIDQGLADGVRAGAAAAAGEVLVGRVAEVLPSGARIELLADPTSTALVQVLTAGARDPNLPEGASAAARGVLRGTGSDVYSLDMIPNDASIAPGDPVVTTGFDAKFPRGLFAGTVAAARPGDIFMSVSVRCPLDLSALEALQILVGPFQSASSDRGPSR